MRIFNFCFFKRIPGIFSALSALFLGAACNDNASKDIDTADSDTGAQNDAGPDASGSDTDTDTDTSDAASPYDVFNPDRVLQISLTLPESEWESLIDQAVDEVYTEANVSIEGEELGAVGLRFKGSYGSLYMCLDDGELTCSKLSMKIKFDKYDEDKRFQGLKRINLHAMENDSSLMHEYFAYKMFRDMGIPTSRVSYADVFVNDELLGLFAVVEQMDGRFTDDRFTENGDGNLYKEAWPVTDSASYYTERLKTNEETADHTAITKFYEALAGASDKELPEVIGAWMDREQLIRYVAVDQAVNNWDGVMTWYCSDETGGGCGNHNFYLYQDGDLDAPLFRLLPWDLDHTFALQSFAGAVPYWEDSEVACDAALYFASSGNYVLPPYCDPILRGLTIMDRSFYENAINELLEKHFVLDDLYAEMDKLAEMLAPSVAADPDRTEEGWLGRVDSLKSNMALLRQRIEMIRDNGSPPEPFFLSTDTLNDFEDTSDVSFAVNVEAWANDQSTIMHGLNHDSPLSGDNDVRLEVEFRDEPNTPWGQWANMDMLFDGAQDFNSLEAVRITLKADNDRRVGIFLNSPLYTTADSGGQWGWSINATADAQTVELSMEDIDYPWWWSSSQVDDLETILTRISALRVQPYTSDTNASGYLNAPESTFVQVDDIEFIFQEEKEEE